MIRLLTTYYQETNSARRAEYDQCLQLNIDCPAIDEIVIFNEGAGQVSTHKKVRTVPTQKRPSYSQFFDYINRCTVACDINIVANTDIYFDASIGVLDHLDLTCACLALSRWDVGSGETRLFDRNDSQDCWIFRGRIKEVEAGFNVGVPRCDNRIAYELEKAGYRVLNPSFSIRAYHLHSGVRAEYNADNLSHFVPPPYKYVWPHNLYGIGRTAVHNIRHRGARLGYRVDTRKLKQCIPCRVARRLVRAVVAAPGG
mgnify:CR=1 FL=1